VTNIRSVRSVDNKWIQQYMRLLCILNADGKVLTWKTTKRLSFQHAENVLLALKERLDAQGQEVEELFIDNLLTSKQASGYFWVAAQGLL